MRNNKKKRVIEKYVTLVEKLYKNSNSAIYYETDVKIYRSEIHILNVIGDKDDIHISEIARKFAVTKGAISKTIKKIERKGLVEKIIDKTNNTRTLVKLTAKGMKAYYAHEKYHEEHDRDMVLYLASLTEHELEVVNIFLEKTNAMAEKHI